METQLKDPSVKLQTIFQPVFTSLKIAQEFPTSEPKPQLIDQQCVFYNFKCDQCDADTAVAICSYALTDIDARPPQAGFLMTFAIVLMLKKCQNKFDCVVYEMLLIKQLRLCLNVQSDSIGAKVFV